MKIKLALTLLIILVVILLLLVSCTQKQTITEINLMNYVEVSFSGEDGKGTANIKLETDPIYHAIKDSEIHNKSDMYYVAEAKLSINASYEYKLDKITSLSNGDVVIVTLIYDDSKLEQYGIRYIGKTTKEIIVTGLTRL